MYIVGNAIRKPQDQRVGKNIIRQETWTTDVIERISSSIWVCSRTYEELDWTENALINHKKQLLQNIEEILWRFPEFSKSKLYFCKFIWERILQYAYGSYLVGTWFLLSILNLLTSFSTRNNWLWIDCSWDMVGYFSTLPFWFT